MKKKSFISSKVGVNGKIKVITYRGIEENY